MRAAIHFFSYHFILNRRQTTPTHVAGFRLIVRPMVFHPRYFLTSAGARDSDATAVTPRGEAELIGAASLAEANRVELTRIVVLNPNIWI